MTRFQHQPHPHVEARKDQAPPPPQPRHPLTRLNDSLAVRITTAVGSMWCAYAFAALALVSLPDAIHQGRSALIAWTAQTFLQLVLLSIILVGQKVAGSASDAQAAATYRDTEAILHELLELQRHLHAQDDAKEGE
jgi:hypothetical protein